MSRLKVNLETFEDVIYGKQISPPERLKTHAGRTAGLLHLNRRSPMVPAPDTPVQLLVTTSGELPLSEVCCWYRIGALSPQRILLDASEVHWDDVLWEYVRTWRGELPAQPDGTLVTYRVAGRRAGTDTWVFADNQASTADDGTVFSYSVDAHPVPTWTADARIYQVFLDRFNPGAGRNWRPARALNDFHGGTLQGVLEKLDYFQELNINTLWLSPLFASPSHHGYDSTDLLNVEPRFGTNEDLELLIREMHSRGMRILLDFVPNHWSDRHPTFLHARAHADSPFRDWFLWNAWPDDYESYFGVRGMPKLNLHAGSPARAHLLEVARYWLQKGADGYRLDHAEGPAHDFWAEFRQTCLQVNPEAWLFGEIVRPPNFLRAYQGSLHGCLDFALARALRETLALQHWQLSKFDAFLRNHFDYFSGEFLSPAFLDNHDMTRFLFISGEDERRLELAALMLFVLPGPPVIYYGTERGISQDRTIDAGVGLDEARKPVDWGDESRSHLKEYFARLGGLRAVHGSWAEKSRHLLLLDDESGVIAYRFGEGSGQVVVVLNVSSSERKIALPCRFERTPRDLLNDIPLNVQQDHTEMTLPPGKGAFLASNDRD